LRELDRAAAKLAVTVQRNNSLEGLARSFEISQLIVEQPKMEISRGVVRLSFKARSSGSFALFNSPLSMYATPRLGHTLGMCMLVLDHFHVRKNNQSFINHLIEDCDGASNLLLGVNGANKDRHIA
jgi:hypothetical protein